MEKKILLATGIQSILFLMLCVTASFLFSISSGAHIRANVFSSLEETNSDSLSRPNYKNGRQTIIIDAGHGGVDSGTQAINLKCNEKDINLAIAQKVKYLLELESDMNIIMTREDDTFLTPEQRINIINQKNADIIISIHCNSADNLDAAGVEVLCSTKKKESRLLAKNCLKELKKATGQLSRGLVNGDNIYIIRNAKRPIALVEVGFLSNKQELAYLLEASNQEKIAQGIVNGIIK